MFTGSTLTSGQSKSGSTKTSVQVKNKIHNFDMDTKREVIESGKKNFYHGSKPQLHPSSKSTSKIQSYDKF